MKKALLFLSLFFALSLMHSCNKDKTTCTTCPTGGNSDCEDIQNVKNFFAFKVGSWWVYEEETSGARDSVYVTSYQNNPANYDFDVRVYSTYQDYYYHFWPANSSTSQQCKDNGIICHRCVKIRRSKYKPGDFVGEGTCFIFLPILGSKDLNPNAFYENNYVYTHQVMDSFALDSFDFNRTIRMFEDNTRIEGIQPTNHYFSEGVGLVRKELLDSNQVWNLVNYHIEE